MYAFYENIGQNQTNNIILFILYEIFKAIADSACNEYLQGTTAKF